LKRHLRDYIPLFVVAAIVLILDQWTKYLVRTSVPYTEAWAPWKWLLPYARIVHWQNTGAAFGMFQGMSLVFAVLAIIVSIAIVYYFPLVPKEDWLIRLALGLQLGGAIGNLIDRLQHGGAVTDFVSLGNFAVFNVADASISVGVVLLILGMWLRERRLERAKRQTDPALAPDSSPASTPEHPDGE
jgi:signal peptidase II